MPSSVDTELLPDAARPRPARRSGRLARALLRSPPVLLGGGLLLVVLLGAALAPWLGTRDPVALNVIARLRPPSAEFWLGTDMYGRDVYSRLIYGCRTSLVVGFTVAPLAILAGLAIGLVGAYVRPLDAVVMRFMDGLMSIPGILLAIALVAVSGAGLLAVIAAITIQDIPRVVRLVRSVVLTVRSEPYVEAAIAAGTRLPALLWRHILPSTIAPLLVLGSYLASSAILIEAVLSFLGVGLPPEWPSWGNMIAEGRIYLGVRPELVFLPGLLLGLTVLAVNLLGDGLSEELDPRMKQRR